MSDSQTLVVKLGTSVLTGGSRRLNRAHIVELVRQCAQLHAAGHRIVIVTSGAIAAGREHLGYPELPATIASKQLLAAVGQSRLIQLWEQLFSIYGIHVGQMLLTRADMEDRIRRVATRLDLTDAKAKDLINKTDKKRASYYNYYTNKKWGEAASYELCLNSSELGVQGTAKAIEQYILLKESIEKEARNIV